MREGHFVWIRSSILEISSVQWPLRTDAEGLDLPSVLLAVVDAYEVDLDVGGDL